MIDTIYVRDLPEREAQLIQSLVDVLRARTSVSEASGIVDDDEFGEWPLGVQGTLSRREIYEDE